MDTNQIIEFMGRHSYLTMALVAVLAMIVANEVHSMMAAGFQLSPDKAVFKFNREGAKFIDLRAQKDFDKVRVIDAINIPLAEIESSANILKKHKKNPLILYSQAGLGVSPSRKALMRQGYEFVFELQGGLDAWKAQNFPVETEKRSK